MRGSARQRLERAGVIHSTLLLFHNHTASLPRHPAPRPVPAAQTGDACQDAALSRCGVILSNPTAGAQQLSPCSKSTCTTSWGCQRSWAPRVPGSAHSPVSAVGDGGELHHCPHSPVSRGAQHRACHPALGTRDCLCVTVQRGMRALEQQYHPGQPQKVNQEPTCLWVTEG